MTAKDRPPPPSAPKSGPLKDWLNSANPDWKGGKGSAKGGSGKGGK